MSGFLRFVGVVNGAVWLGAAVFFSFVVGPAFFSSAMVQALQHKYYAGLAAQVMIHQYFLLHLWCAAIALVHALAEWLYLGRPLGRVRVALWLGVVVLALGGGVGVQPKLRALHETMYRAPTLEERLVAGRSFRIWHGVSQTANLLLLAGVLGYFWRVLNPPDAPRFATWGKFRS